MDIIVDIPQLKTMLDARLPLVLRGAPLSETESVWPSADPAGPQPWTTRPGRKPGPQKPGGGKKKKKAATA